MPKAICMKLGMNIVPSQRYTSYSTTVSSLKEHCSVKTGFFIDFITYKRYDSLFVVSDTKIAVKGK
jgi:hypothetical protein